VPESELAMRLSSAICSDVGEASSRVVLNGNDAHAERTRRSGARTSRVEMMFRGEGAMAI